MVNAAIEKMDLSALLAQYKGGGTSSYHPKMLMKVLAYAYTQQLYSSRKIAKALRENIYFMWLSGNQQPDFRTINRFRSEVVKEVIEDIFTYSFHSRNDNGYRAERRYYEAADCTDCPLKEQCTRANRIALYCPEYGETGGHLAASFYFAFSFLTYVKNGADSPNF